MRFYLIFFTIEDQIVIDSFMKGGDKLSHAFAFKIYKTVNPFYLTEKYTVLLTESNCSDKIFIFKCIHHSIIL